jgi:hypothetical protein
MVAVPGYDRQAVQLKYHLSTQGTARVVRANGLMNLAKVAQLQEVAALIDMGQVKPVVSTVFQLAET